MGKYSTKDQSEAAEHTEKLAQFPSMEGLGITPDTDMNHDVGAMVDNAGSMSNQDLQDWAAMYQSKTAKTNSEYTKGQEGGVSSREIADAINSGDYKKARELAAALKAKRAEKSKKKKGGLSPSTLVPKAAAAAAGAAGSVTGLRARDKQGSNPHKGYQ